ncbi:meiotic recombination protein W68 [Phlebotomus papatasi]|uniref:meiotic recombination protein W68 n=1 Tax=Phlebotomus papatasi TaxID=29031 RepID=UPI002483A76D|nr:meiotic recombination protein W68 [Phlebotomus papatasi]
MSFSIGEEELMNELLNSVCPSLNGTSDTDEFELNVDSKAFLETGSEISDDLDLDISFGTTYLRDLVQETVPERSIGSSEQNFCIFKEVEKYERSLKKSREERKERRRMKFNKMFRPLACSTPLSHDFSLEVDDLKEIEEICQGTTTFNTTAVDTKVEPRHQTPQEILAKNTTTVSVDLLEGINWSIYRRAPSVAPTAATSIAQTDNLRNTIATPILFPSILLNEYSASSSIMATNNFFSQPEPESTSKNDGIVKKIENIVESLVEDLCCGNTLALQIKDNCQSNTEMINEVLKIKPNERANFKMISLYNRRSANNFGVIILLLGEVYKNLMTNSGSSKREIFYRHTKMVKNSSFLHGAILDMCLLLDITPWDAGITATSKGLVCGPLRIIMDSNDVIDCNAIFEGTGLPHNFTAMSKFETTAKFVLVVEKDTVFERLLRDDIFSRISTPFILVTGKGVPDTCTRIFLKKIWDYLALPIKVLVDADPYGIDIMLMYKHGSRKMCQQADYLAVPSIKWIGLHPSDLKIKQITTLKLTSSDQKRLNDILSRHYLTPSVAEELRILRENGVKAEIEGLYTLSDNYIIDEYLIDKITYDSGI